MRDDLTGMVSHDFEQLCRALAICVLGPGITAFGSGRDGGREASYSGRQQYPNIADPWDGYGIGRPNTRTSCSAESSLIGSMDSARDQTDPGSEEPRD